MDRRWRQARPFRRRLETLAHLDDKVYFGGPVEIQSVSFLFRFEKPPEHATEVLDGVYFSTDRELLRQLLGRDGCRRLIRRRLSTPIVPLIPMVPTCQAVVLRMGAAAPIGTVVRRVQYRPGHHERTVAT